MIDTDKVRVRFEKACDQFESYTPTIESSGRKITVANKYTVDLDLVTCSCRDSEIRGNETPCKHIIMVWLYLYAKKRQDPHPF